MSRPPLQITVYDKDFTPVGRIGDPKFVTVTHRHNKAGAATIGLLATHRMIPHLFTEGARLHLTDENGEHVLSGAVDRIRGKGPAKQATFEVDVDDDFRILEDVLGWVLPAEAITEQGTATRHNYVFDPRTTAVTRYANPYNGTVTIASGFDGSASSVRHTSTSAGLCALRAYVDDTGAQEGEERTFLAKVRCSAPVADLAIYFRNTVISGGGTMTPIGTLPVGESTVAITATWPTGAPSAPGVAFLWTSGTTGDTLDVTHVALLDKGSTYVDGSSPTERGFNYDWSGTVDDSMTVGEAADYWTLTGPAETVLKAAVQENAIDRLGMPLVCATDQGRGSTITASLRFHPLYDRLFPVVDGAGLEAAGIGVTVQQVDDHLVLDVYEPSAYPRDLTESSGVVTEWSYSHQAAAATRVAIGGSGEAQLRSFRTVIDTSREATEGRIIERFRDARDVAQDDPDMVPTLYARGQETLDEGAAKDGLSVTLSQTENFRYPSSVRVGDQVTVAVSDSVLVTDTLSEAVLSWTRDDGWHTTPKVGDHTDETDESFARALRALARTLSNQNRT